MYYRLENWGWNHLPYAGGWDNQPYMIMLQIDIVRSGIRKYERSRESVPAAPKTNPYKDLQFNV